MKNILISTIVALMVVSGGVVAKSCDDDNGNRGRDGGNDRIRLRGDLSQEGINKPIDDCRVKYRKKNNEGRVDVECIKEDQLLQVVDEDVIATYHIRNDVMTLLCQGEGINMLDYSCRDRLRMDDPSIFLLDETVEIGSGDMISIMKNGIPILRATFSPK